MENVIIIGGGPAGLMAAISAAKRQENKNITVIEKNERMARKLMITGKGRCNVTNNCNVDTLIANVPQNGRFLYSAFNRFNSADTMSFFENAGVPLKTERGNRVFPQSDKAVDIVDGLVKTAKRLNVKQINSTVKCIKVKDSAAVGVELQSGEIIPADSVVLATGGVSYPVTGSTGDGYRMAGELGHTVTELRPSLVPLNCHEGFCSRLSGLSLRNVTLSIFEGDRKKAVYKDMGEMLFTHFGISGPLVLSASAYLRKMGKTEYRAVIDLKPALTEEQLDKRILRDFEAEKNKDFGNSLDALLPKSIIPVIIGLSDIDPRIKVNQISREQRLRLCGIIKNFTLHITGFRPIEEAIITSGGIKVSEINPSTMESKLIKGLFLAGEIIDVDAFTGGFNLQIAFSTGFLAGENV